MKVCFEINLQYDIQRTKLRTRFFYAEQSLFFKVYILTNYILLQLRSYYDCCVQNVELAIFRTNIFQCFDAYAALLCNE